MARRRQPSFPVVLFVGALYYLVALPLGYVHVADALGCRPSFYCCYGTRRAPLQAVRSAAMLYVTDDPGSCPTVEALVEERYLGAYYLDDVDVDEIGICCREGDIDVYGPGPPPPVLWMRVKGWLCGGLLVGATAWALPFRGWLDCVFGAIRRSGASVSSQTGGASLGPLEDISEVELQLMVAGSV